MNCKLCGLSLVAYNNSDWAKVCPQCPAYKVNLRAADGLDIYSESICYGGFMLVKFYHNTDAIVIYKQANPLGNWNVFLKLPETELTQELARKWLVKLQTYTVFQ